MSHIHILFTMLIILNITTNRLTAASTSKTYYMLDFNEAFWHADKRGKTAKKTAEKRGKLWILKFFLRTQSVADGTHADALRCVRQSTDVDALSCGCGLFAHLYHKPCPFHRAAHGTAHNPTSSSIQRWQYHI